MHHPFSLALLFGWLASFSMIWIALAMPAKALPQNYFAAGLLLYVMVIAAAVDWIDRNRP